MKRVVSIVISVAALLVQAVGADLRSPRLGYIWDSGAQVLRPIEGIPGAAFVGEAVDLGGEFAYAVVCRKLHYILAVSSMDGTPLVLEIGAKGLLPHAIQGAALPIDRVVLSPSGTSALLYDSAHQTLQILTGLPAKPVVRRAVTLPSIDQMSVSDDGVLVLLATKGTLQPAFLSERSDVPLILPLQGPVSAMALRPNSHEALIAAAGRITWISALGGDATYTVVDEDPNPPAGVSFSSDSTRFLTAYADGRVSVRSLATGESATAVCPCAPDRLQPLDDGAVFALNQPVPGPLFLYDGVNNRIVFVARGDQ